MSNTQVVYDLIEIVIGYLYRVLYVVASNRYKTTQTFLLYVSEMYRDITSNLQLHHTHNDNRRCNQNKRVRCPHTRHPTCLIP